MSSETVLLKIRADDRASAQLEELQAQLDRAQAKLDEVAASARHASEEMDAGGAKVETLGRDMEDIHTGALEKATGDLEGLSGSAKRGADEVESAASKIEGDTSSMGAKAGGIFDKLSQKMGSLGLPFSESVGKMGEKSKEVEGNAASLGGKLTTVSNIAAVSVVAGFAGAAAEGVKLAEGFQKTTALLASTAGISTQAARQIGNAFLSTAGQSRYSAEQMMSAYQPVAGEFDTLAGKALSSSQALTVMKAAMDGAEATGEPLAGVAKTLADTMRVYHMKVSGAAGATNIMFNTSRMLGTSIATFGTTLQRIEPRIVGSGMSLSQTSGFMLQLANVAGRGRQAMRLAGQAIQQMITPTPAAQKALGQMGISLTNANGKFIGMKAALGLLHGAMQKLPGGTQAAAAAQKLLALQTQLAKERAETQTPALKKQEAAIQGQIPALTLQTQALSKTSVMQSLFGRQANIMSSMIAGGVPAFDKATTAVKKQGMAAKGAQDYAKTFAGQMEQLKATGEDLATKLGNVLVPIITKVASTVMKATNYVMHHKDVLIALAVVIGGLVSIAVVNFAAKKLKAMIDGMKMARENVGKLITSLGHMGSKLGSIGSKVASAVSGMIAKFRGMGDAAKASAAETEAAGETVEATEEGMGEAGEAAGAGMDAAMGPIGLIIMLLIPVITYLMHHWKHVWRVMKEVALEVWHFLDRDVIKPISHIIKWIVEFIKTHWKLLLPILLFPFAPVIILVELFHKQILGFIKKIIDWIKTHWKLLVAILTGPFAPVVAAVLYFHSQIVGFFKQLWHDITKVWQALWNGLKTVAGIAWLAINAAVIEPIKLAINGVKVVIHAFGTAWRIVWNGIKTVVSTVWNFVKPIIHAISAGVRMIGGAVKTVSGFVGGVGHAIGSFFAEGGIVSKPTYAVVGEAGPEAIVPLSKPARAREIFAQAFGESDTAGGSALRTGAGVAHHQTLVTIDLRGTQVMSDNDVNMLLDKIGARLVKTVLPQAGVRVRH